MEDRFLEILKEIRYAAREKNLKDFTFYQIEKKTGISKEELTQHVKSKEELVERILDLERQKFMNIFLIHDFEGVNAIDILFTVSKEVANNFLLVSPAITIHLK